MKNFALTGAAGYIAPRHLAAIKATGNNLIAAVDPNDSVGILDSYFPNTAFFTEIERFDRHLDKLRRNGQGIDYLSICSPNHLHDAHIRLALRNNAHAICEKPLVLNPWNLDLLEKLEEEYQKKIYTILQLRVHPALVALKKKLDGSGNGKRETEDTIIRTDNNSQFTVNSSLINVDPELVTAPRTKHEVTLTYITSRGIWYNYSWKGDPQKSGGIATNIGVHFFDLLIWLFGKPVTHEVHLSEFNKMAGFIELERANVKWFLSIDSNDIGRIGETIKDKSKKEKDTSKNVTPSQSTERSRSGVEVKTRELSTPNQEQITDTNSLLTVNRSLINDEPELVTPSPSLRPMPSALTPTRTLRSIQIDGEEIEFTEGFTDLHTGVYNETLLGRGLGIEDARNSIELVHRLRNEMVVETVVKEKLHKLINRDKVTK